ncbi:MAG: N-acetylmuramoyl-L-alanine amidase, partial [Oscillospiraceae bacterium]|nr:N-acetylmuramoyl-L-alanine amidase [Oscillospiraceae bacterium]
FFNSIGLMAIGWTDYRTDKYYFHEDGIMQTGMMEMDGQKYRFEENGVYHPIKICLDAGHYAKYNRSTVVAEYWESDFTWKIHLYLKDALEAYGIEVITTREDKDTDLGLKTRGRTSEGCDLFLSLHSNACNNPSIDAPLACCQINGSADELGQMLANLVAEVMETKQKGTIWKRPGTKEPDKDWYSVLYGAAEVGTPGILLEHSYHTNLRSTNWLLNDDNVKRMADAEAELLARYFDMIE